METQQKNLRELIASRGVTYSFIAKALGIRSETMSRRVSGETLIGVPESRILSQVLRCEMEEVIAAAEETARRPGEPDARGRKPERTGSRQANKTSLGGEKKNGASGVGLGTARHGALAADV